MEKCAAIRELIRSGGIYLAITKYQEGKISIGRYAGMADRSLSNLMELISKLGIERNIERNDYLQRIEHLKKVFQANKSPTFAQIDFRVRLESLTNGSQSLILVRWLILGR